MVANLPVHEAHLARTPAAAIFGAYFFRICEHQRRVRPDRRVDVAELAG